MESKSILKKGDFIIIDFVGKIKETGEIFDTTFEETAKREKLFKEKEHYEAKLIVMGEGWLLKPLDDRLMTMEIGKPTSVEIPAEKAFGPIEPENLKHVSVRNLKERGITPSVGMKIEFGGKFAIIRTLDAGRVLLDFNNVLSGKTLVYDVTIKQKLETDEEKIYALIHRRFPTIQVDKFEFDIKESVITIIMPEETFRIEGIQQMKRGITQDLDKFLPAILGVKFVEIIKITK